MPIKRIQKITSIICLTLAGTISILLYFSISEALSTSQDLTLQEVRSEHSKSNTVTNRTDFSSVDSAVTELFLSKPVGKGDKALMHQEVELNNEITTNQLSQKTSEMIDDNNQAINMSTAANEFPNAVETLPTPAREFIRLEALKRSVNQRIDDLLKAPLDQRGLEQLKRDIEELHQKAVLLPDEANRFKRIVISQQQDY